MITQHAWGSEETCLEGKQLSLRKLHVDDGCTVVLCAPLHCEQAWVVTRGRVEVRSYGGDPGVDGDPLVRANPGQSLRVKAIGRVTLVAISAGSGLGATLIKESI